MRDPGEFLPLMEAPPQANGRGFFLWVRRC